MKLDEDRLRELAAKATPGPWFYNGYAMVFSSPKVAEYGQKEQNDEEPLPETLVCWVPTISGDTATQQGMVDALYIQEACNSVPLLLAEIDILRSRLKSRL